MFIFNIERKYHLIRARADAPIWVYIMRNIFSKALQWKFWKWAKILEWPQEHVFSTSFPRLDTRWEGEGNASPAQRIEGLIRRSKFDRIFNFKKKKKKEMYS